MGHDLSSVLNHEIEVMREILSNLHQEELALLENDRKQWVSVMEQRSDHVLNLKDIRYRRLKTTEEMIKLASFLGKKELLPVQEEGSCDILSKLDQVFALLDRMNLQNCRNAALFEQSKQKQELPLQCPFPHPLHKSSRKTKVATYTQRNP